MTAPLVSRLTAKRDDRFAELLDPSTPAAVGAADPTLGPLVTVAGALRAAGRTAHPTAPDPAFRDALRQRLVAVATVQATAPVVASPSASRRLQQRIAALVGTVAVASSVVGVGVAAARSLPGDPLYGVKRATEAVQLWTARGDLAKGKRHLEFARTRLAEAEALPAGSSHLSSTLAAMNTQTTDGSHDLISAYTSSKSLEPLADLVTFSRQQVAGLRALAPTLPPAIRRQDLRSIVLVTGVVRQAHAVSNGVCVRCGPRPGSVPGSGQSVLPTPSPSSSTPRPSRSHSASPSPGAGPDSAPPATQLPTHHPSGLPTLPTKVPTLPTILPTLPTLPLHHRKHPHPSSVPLPIVSTLLSLAP